MFRSHGGVGVMSLTSLNVSRNGLDGMLPGAWGACGQLTSIDISFNAITGGIPLGKLDFSQGLYKNRNGRFLLKVCDSLNSECYH